MIYPTEAGASAERGGFMDTTIINEIIDKGELEKKLKRVI
jgi:hypothetical protein